ncbi:MAG: Alpha(1,3)rhamnosyltransferase EpsG, partial [uncultured bacterium]
MCKSLSTIKILFISSRADIGGGPLQMFDIIANIDRGKFTPFAALPDEEPFYGRIGAAGVKTLPIKKRAVSIFDFYELAKFVYSNNIDIVHSHGKGAGVYSRLLKLFCPRVKIVHTFHGFHYDNMPVAKIWMHKSTEKLLSGFTDRFVNVSEGEQLQYMLAGLLDFRKTVIIKNHVPLESLKLMESFIKQSKFSASNDDGIIRFCAAARFDPVKQMPFLVESFVKALNRIDLQGKIKLLLIGGGEEFETCRGLADKMNAGSAIEFLG